jgi:hypothetical protein
MQAPSAPTAPALDAWTTDLARPGDLVAAIDRREALGPRTARQLAVGIAGAALFGLALGSFGFSWPQMISGAIKAPLLLLATGALCLPSFYALQLLRAAKPASLSAATAMQAAAAAAAGAVWGGLSLPLAFLVVTTRHYHLSQFLALLVGALGGIGGLRRLTQLYRNACDAGDERLLHRFAVTLPWALLYSAVGAQLAWMLRPFIGSPELAFQIFRPLEGNMFSAILRILA